MMIKRKKINLTKTVDKEDTEFYGYRTYPFEMCSNEIIRTQPLTNRELCEMLDPLHEIMYSHMLSDSEPKIEELEQVRDILNKIFTLLQNSFHCSVSGGYCYAADIFSTTPLSGRQANRAMAVIDLLYEKEWTHAFHEMYDMIDDNGFAQREFQCGYKEVSVNEYALYSVMVSVFIKEISNFLN